jgi:hypothetical protein
MGVTMWTKYRIFCEVYGGGTGHRSGWLKDTEGNAATFPTLEAAQAEAKRLSDRTNGNPHRTATFKYTVRED